MVDVSVVTPRVGVWIETIEEIIFHPYLSVTPRVGVWIETSHNFNISESW